jgi:hypothetical protein
MVQTVLVVAIGAATEMMAQAVIAGMAAGCRDGCFVVPAKDAAAIVVGRS